MSNTLKHAERELQILVKTAGENDRPIIERFIPELLAIAEKFGTGGESGGSAPYTARALAQAVEAVCLQQPICPIQGTDDEWYQLDPQHPLMWQNNRCGAVFRYSDGQAYYLDAISWVIPSGIGHYGPALLPDGQIIKSQQRVRFPFTPKTFYIEVDEKEIAPGDWEFTIKNPADLDAVFEYYDKMEAVENL